jgi:hypothetical protein
MKEETMRHVMINYFKSHRVEVIPQRGAGPDLHIKGERVVEVKGSRYDFAKMLRQLTDYAMKNAEVALALPYDGLTFERVHKLSALASLIEMIGSKLALYLVAPAPKDKDLFYVKLHKSVPAIFIVLGPDIVHLGLDPKDPTSTIGQAVENLISYTPSEFLKNATCSDFDYTVCKVRI